MKKNIINSLIFSALALSAVPSLQAQEEAPSQTASKLEQYAAQLQQGISKIIKCARGDAACTREEINQTRATIAGVVVLLGTLVTGAIVKKRGWRPFSKRKPQPEPAPIFVSEESEEKEIPEKEEEIQEQSESFFEKAIGRGFLPLYEIKQKLLPKKQTLPELGEELRLKKEREEQSRQIKEHQQRQKELQKQKFKED